MTDRTYRERREAKAERLAEWAEKREAKATADLDRARTMGDLIPFGQPVLVGHHSEKRDRSYRNKIGNTYDRAFEHASKAEDMARRSASIEGQLARSIYDDDPDAIEQLQARIARLESERDAIKSANSAYRKAHKTELANMSVYERNQTIPYPPYHLQNLSGNIKRNRDRLAMLETRKERVDASTAAGGMLVEHLAHGYVRVTFSEKPSRDVLDTLKAAGYRWGKGSWTGQAPVPDGVEVQR